MRSRDEGDPVPFGRPREVRLPEPAGPGADARDCQVPVAAIRPHHPYPRKCRVGVCDPLTVRRPTEVGACIGRHNVLGSAVSAGDHDAGRPGDGSERVGERSPVWRPAGIRPVARAEADDRPHPAGGLRDADDPPAADQVGELAPVRRERHLRAWGAQHPQVRAVAVHDRRATNITYRELAGRPGRRRCCCALRLPRGRRCRAAASIGVVEAEEPDSCNAKESTCAVSSASLSCALARLLDQRFTIVGLVSEAGGERLACVSGVGEAVRRSSQVASLRRE